MQSRSGFGSRGRHRGVGESDGEGKHALQSCSAGLGGGGTGGNKQEDIAWPQRLKLHTAEFEA